jgi:hypothetical protein
MRGRQPPALAPAPTAARDLRGTPLRMVESPKRSGGGAPYRRELGAFEGQVRGGGVWGRRDSFSGFRLTGL